MAGLFVSHPEKQRVLEPGSSTQFDRIAENLGLSWEPPSGWSAGPERMAPQPEPADSRCSKPTG